MDDVPIIFIAILGGMSQRLFSPKLMLTVSAVSGIFSWLILALDPGSIACLLLSRATSGLATGLSIGNIYLSNVASREFLGSFSMIQVIPPPPEK